MTNPKIQKLTEMHTDWEPVIAIDRRLKQFARFNGFTMLKPYREYLTEEQAIEESKAWFAERTENTAKVVYPKLTSVKIL